MIKYIIFDFDGVIADSFFATVEIYNKKKHEYPEIAEIDMNHIRDVGTKQALKDYKISPLKIIKIMRILQKEYSHKISSVDLISNMDYVIKKLSEKYKIGILSSNSRGNIKKFLHHHNLSKYFMFIHSQTSIFGKHLTMKKIMTKYKLKHNDIIYVGDEDRDIEAMDKLKIPIISVTWGYNSEHYLKKLNHKYLATKPQQILRYVDKISNF